jgi:hypothetical protein
MRSRGWVGCEDVLGMVQEVLRVHCILALSLGNDAHDYRNQLMGISINEYLQ